MGNLTATVVDEKRRPYRLTMAANSPRETFSFKVPVRYTEPQVEEVRDKYGNIIEKEIQYFRTIDVCTIRQVFNGSDVGSDVVGKIHYLSDRELEDLKKDVSRFVVRWENRPAKPERGVGPNKAFARGSVLDTGHRRYRRDPRHEPLEKYIAIKPMTEMEAQAYNAVGRVEVGGFDTLQSEIDRVRSAEGIDVSKELKELEAARERLERERKAFEEAKKAEREAMSTPEGRAEQATQSMKKKRGRPSKGG